MKFKNGSKNWEFKSHHFSNKQINAHEKVMDYFWLRLWVHLSALSVSFRVDNLVDVNQAASDDVIAGTVVQSKSQICVEGWREAAQHKKKCSHTSTFSQNPQTQTYSSYVSPDL